MSGRSAQPDRLRPWRNDGAAEPAALGAAADLLRPGGGIGVVTQGPPLWWGTAPWQRRVREVLERRFGPATDTCGSDTTALRPGSACWRTGG
jgi:hypothetical protein